MPQDEFEQIEVSRDRLVASAADHPPQDFAERAAVPPQFEILECLGQGGMGVVYKVQNKFTGKLAAVKVLHHNAKEVSLQRFQREAQAACALEHPNVVRTTDFGMTLDTPYLVMEFVDGETLQARLNRECKLSWQDALPIFKQIAAGVACAHASNVVHRDLKPSNIILHKTANGEVAKIFDFGIAKVDAPVDLTQTGEVFGTPLYMSPEQLKGERTDARSDVYSLGALMYQVLAGVPPHISDTAFGTMYKRLNEQPKSFGELAVEIPTALENVVFKCLHLDPGYRYSDASGIKSEIERFENSDLASRAVQKVAPMSGSGRSSKPKNATQKTLLISCSVLGLVAALAMYAGLSYFRSVDVNHRIDELCATSDYALKTGDIEVARAKANEAAAIASTAGKNAVSKARRISIIQRQVNSANALHDDVAELGSINQLIATDTSSSDNLLNEKVLNRRLNLLDALFVKGDRDVSAASSKNSSLSELQKMNLWKEATRYYEASMDCANDAYEPDSRVLDKLPRLVKSYMLAIENLDDPDSRDAHLQKVMNLLPKIHSERRVMVFYYLGLFWNNLAEKRESSGDPTSGAAARKESDVYFQKTIDASQNEPAHTFALASYRFLAMNLIVAKKYDRARVVLEKAMRVIDSNRGKDDPDLMQHATNTRDMLQDVLEHINLKSVAQ